MFNNSKSAMGFLGKLTRRYSWYLVVALIAIASALMLGAAAAVYFGFPDYQEQLLNAAQSLGGIGAALGSIQAYWKQIRRKYALAKLQHAQNHVVVCGLGDKGMRLVDTFLNMDKAYQVVVIDSKANHPESNSCWERGVVVITGDASDHAILDDANAARAKFVFAVTGNDETNIEIARTADLVAEEAYKDGEQVFLRCFSHVVNASKRDIFSRHELFEKSRDGFDASMFSVYESAARFAVERFPPDIYAATCSIQTPLKILVVGFGRMGEALTKQIARIGHYLQWDQVEITVVDKGMRISGERFLGAYGDGNMPPSFIVPGISIRFVDKEPDAIGSLREIMGDDTQPVAVYFALEQDSNSISLALRLRGFLEKETAPIICCMHSPLSKLMENNEFTFLQERNVQAFNLLDFACATPVLMEEVTDEIARSIHSAYVNSLIIFSESDFSPNTAVTLLEKALTDIPCLIHRLDRFANPIEALNRIMAMPDLYDFLSSQKSIVLTAPLIRQLSELGNLRNKPAEELSIPQQELVLRFNEALMAATWPKLCPDKVSENSSLTGWRELTEDKKDSNRCQADHLSVKLRAIGYEEADLASIERASSDPNLLRRLSDMEHRRWCAALLIDGWRYGRGKKDNLRKTHPCLVPYEELSEIEKAKDYTMIYNISNLLGSPSWKRYCDYIPVSFKRT